MRDYMTTLFCLLLFIAGFLAIAFMAPGPTSAQKRMDMRMSMSGATGGPVTWENYQVSDGVGGWDDYQVSDGAAGWDDYQVRQ